MRHTPISRQRTTAVLGAAAFAVIGVLAACNKDASSDSNTQKVTATDTTTMTTPVKDTAIVKHDTTVTVDTVKKTTHAKKAKKS